MSPTLSSIVAALPSEYVADAPAAAIPANVPAWLFAFAPRARIGE